MKANLGELSLLDVRSIWRHEASDFTPWLANDENISKLSVALGTELEVECSEL